MQISCVVDGQVRVGQGPWMSGRFVRRSLARGLGAVLLTMSLGGVAMAQAGPLVLGCHSGAQISSPAPAFFALAWKIEAKDHA